MPNMRLNTAWDVQVAALTEAHAGCGAAAAAAAREAAALRQKAAQLAADRLQAAANLRRAENEARAKLSGAACQLLSQRPRSARRGLKDLLGRQAVKGVFWQAKRLQKLQSCLQLYVAS